MKNILVTGVKQGLGLQITKTLLEQYYKVYGVAIDLSADLQILKNQHGDRLNIITADLADIELMFDSCRVKKIGLKPY